jgi:hypothetical protein
MTEKKKVDRIFIDKKDRADFESLRDRTDSPFVLGKQHAQNKEVFLAAMVVGFHEGGRIEVKNKEEWIFIDYLSKEEDAMIKAIAIAEEGNLNVLLDEQKVYSIAQEYATGGISLLMAKVFSGEYFGSYAKKLESELLRKYEKIMENRPKQAESFDEIANVPILDLIKNGESGTVEFKSSLLWDYKNEKPSKDVKMVVAKAVSSFMNSNGGILLVGIDDDGTILGLKEDLAVLHKSRDEFERTFKSLINTYLNKMCGAFVNVKFEKVDDKELAVIYVKRSTRPVYFRPEGRKEEFYIRLGNSCEPLDISEANLYIKDHWPNLT